MASEAPPHQTDVSVICEPAQYDPADSKQETIENPRVSVEVVVGWTPRPIFPYRDRIPE